MNRLALVSLFLCLPVLADEKPKWDVEKSTGPTHAVTIDTDEGTWMNVDVSPDGRTVVFDLLGDLYTVPIGGGAATALTSGVAWDQEPRFSPDGKRIAFTSDRDGADNVWILPAAGGAPTQVTKEDFRLVNSPVWTPDGQYLAVRKHFTSERSLGAGEIWLYHRAGGKGVQLVEKPNDQKDLGEPAFSPDGRMLYYSQDVTPGDFFEYNKNPHAGIYAIKRLDRDDGVTRTILRGPGGAVRPTPSPDGKRLAYVRRDGLKTVLVVRELGSGVERIADDGLDRDMQETWAIHGVYPSMGWTRDGKTLVYWAGGQIRRLDGNTARAIPFRVKSARTVTEALRFPVEVAPKTFHTRMLRWPQVAPDGRAVVYQALGKLWIRDLPTGKPRRLTSDEGVMEVYPSFSRDGKSVVYVAWNDQTLGSVRIVARGGGKGRTLTREPGHYLEPVLSPDGKQVVVRRATGGGLVSPHWSDDPGLYVLPATGGPAVLLTKSGTQPHFGAASSRVFYLESEPKPGEPARQVVVLRSIGLDRAEPRGHVRADLATELRVSPDGKWLAFAEGYQVYLTPMPRSPGVVEVGPKMENLPVARVTKDSGSYLSWSGDSRRLHWSLGPELFSRELTESFAFLEGAPARLPEPAAKGIDVGFDVTSDAPPGVIALVGARLVTMKGDEVIDDGVIVVEGNRIAAIGPRARVTIPAGAKRFDLSGATIIPGLVDVHAHGSQGENGITPQQSWLHAAELAFGVTTVHDPSNDTGEIFAAAELARAGQLAAPRIFSTGTILYGARDQSTAPVASLDDARGHLYRMRAVGAFSVKSYNQPRRSQRQQILAAARELGMMVVPEGGSLLPQNLSMIVDGHTGIEHAVPVGRGYRDLVQLWAGTKVGYTPTLIVGYGGLMGEIYWYAQSDVFAHPRLRGLVPPHVLDARARRREEASDGDWNHVAAAKLAKQLGDAGVNVQLGAHGQREGLGAHWELWMFVQGGMTPHQALRAGTLNGARYLGLDRDIGSLEVGKLADLAVIEGDVLADIRKSENVKYTMVNGRLYDARTVDELAPRAKKRARFWWE